MPAFMFATGIENSYPTIADGVRVDEMEKCGHYEHWRDDLALVREMNLSYLRWGPAIHKTWLGPKRYDWSWADEVIVEMGRLGIEPILDLCHFGVPDWLGNFQNPDFAPHFAEYAGAFAARYPQIRYWTPINEILITALFSAKYGWWNERLTSDEAFVRAVIHLCRATVLARQAIQVQVPLAYFVHSESCEYTHPARPDCMTEAAFHNERRFLPLDLIYGRGISPSMLGYVRSGGMTRDDYAFFMNQGRPSRCILGTDYYCTNEHLLKPDGTTRPAGEVFGYCLIVRQYYERYKVPMMHTETNRWEKDDAPQWLWKQWYSVLHLREQGIPIAGFTWYSLTDQMDWDTALRDDARRVNAVGLFDLDRKMRKVGRDYRRLIKEWAEFVAVDEATPVAARKLHRAA